MRISDWSSDVCSSDLMSGAGRPGRPRDDCRPVAGRPEPGGRRMPYKGSCHCGGVAFEVAGELTMAVAFNSSISTRKGALLWAVPRDRLRPLSPADGTGPFTFNRPSSAERLVGHWCLITVKLS